MFVSIVACRRIFTCINSKPSRNFVTIMRCTEGVMYQAIIDTAWAGDVE